MKYYVLPLLFGLIRQLAFSQDDQDYPYVRPLFDFQPAKPLFVFNAEQGSNNRNRSLRYYALSGYREGAPSTSGPFGMTFSGISDETLGIRRLFMYNLSMVEMLTYATGNNDKILLRVKDPSRYRYLPEYGNKEAWLRKNGRCFEMMMPLGGSDFGLFDELINNVLGTKTTRELCKVNVMVLTRTNSAEQFKSQLKGDKGYQGNGKFLHITFNDFGQVFRERGQPFIDETKYRGLVDLNLKMDNWKDLSAVNKALVRYGLKVTTEIRDIEMIVISEVKGAGQ